MDKNTDLLIYITMAGHGQYENDSVLKVFSDKKEAKNYIQKCKNYSFTRKIISDKYLEKEEVEFEEWMDEHPAGRDNSWAQDYYIIERILY